VRRVLLAMVVAALCWPAWAQPPGRGEIRVGLWTLWHDRQVSLKPVAGGTLRLCASCAAGPLRAVGLEARGDRVAWSEGGRSGLTREMRVEGGYEITAHGERLTMTFPLRVAAAQGALVLVATVPLERYVELVVSAESGAADSAESRKALAVVARSFALMPSHGHAGFDVCDSTHCQWVHWRTTAEAHAATLATSGESLWFHGGRTAAYFHQNCGGRTAAANEVWPAGAGHAEAGVLVSHPDPYCVRTGSSEWSATLSRPELTHALAAAGLAAPGWKSLTVAQRGESGRATVVQAGLTKIAAENFRLAVGRDLGWNRIRSNWFEITAEGDSFLFHGRGSGHGVGLCQTGAAEMAREGMDYRQILAQYFPGATEGELTTGAAWQRLPGHGFALETSDAADIAFVPALQTALGEAQSRSGLVARTPLVVRAYRSTPAFRDATLAPGWVAAFTEGDRIAVQPLRVLAGRKLLAGIARHEFLHALVEEQCGANAPLWLREGLVELWSGDPLGSKPSPSPEQASVALAHAGSERESEAAHAAAAWYAGKLVTRFGRTQVLEWLRSGLPAAAFDALR